MKLKLELELVLQGIGTVWPAEHAWAVSAVVCRCEACRYYRGASKAMALRPWPRWARMVK